jgi:alcohol dehydrogenase (cytochrome c)
MKRTLLVCIGLATLGVSADARAQVDGFTPVTEDMLRSPAPGDWPNWRRTDDAWGYSPLTQITTDNVGQLQLAWSWAMDDTGGQEAAPLVHDGVMYLPSPRGVIQALDAASGDFLWEYRPGATLRMDGTPTVENSGLPAGAFAGVGRGVQKNIAIYGDMIYSATGSASIVALDARSGRQVWETQTADPALGYFYTAGPIVADGVLVTGITGCDRFKEDVCFITGHDPQTGEELWRTSTVARPGEPGGDTWSDLPLEFRAGSDAWIAGSYDAEAGLVYWATSQAKPWARAVRGTAGDALYTNSSLALDPSTGELVWYYQYLPGETHDMDEVFESVLIDVDGRPSLFKMGKLGILWQIDRVTGEFINATDIGYQNILDVNPSDGGITYRPGMVPEMGVEIEMCPSTSGFKSWRAMAYSPQTEVLYIPITFNCERATFGPTEQVLGGGGTGPVRRINTPHPASGGNLGELLALDIRTGSVVWRHRTRSPINTAALTTAGGLVFAGDWDRHMYAYDAATGDILWQSRLPTSTQGFPISYMVDGRQYVAMPVGSGGSSWSTMLPRDLIPDIRRPANGNSIHVFALPD